MNSLTLIVTAVRSETSNIRSLVLERKDGGPLPGWTAGAHVKIELPGGDSRSYSLVNASPVPRATADPRSYRLGVRLEDASKGGSLYMHALREGDVVHVSSPENRFPLRADDSEIVLLAGGIGITPLLSMASELTAAGRRFRFIYAGRSPEHLAFLPEVKALAPADLTIHTDDQSGMLDIDALMRSLGEDGALYVCGPLPLIDATIAYARAHDFAEGRVNFEIFAEQAPAEGDAPFEIVLADSGRRISVAADQTILQALIDAGEDIMFDCERGDCGMCQMRVVEGIPDHRDYYLSDAERAANTLIQVCVSRAKTPVLVLESQS